MGTTPFRIAVALVASVALLGVSGCSKKSVQSGGDTQSSQSKTAKSESTESSRTGVGSFPDTSMQSGGGSGLRGLDRIRPKSVLETVQGRAQERAPAHC
jgi:peptidoglycan-associated lipoprotein